MSTQVLSRETALRIGLAARVLPGVDVRRLVDILTERVGMPVTEAKLSKITLADLQTGLASPDGEVGDEDAAIGMEYLKLAVKHLWGGEAAASDLPPAQPYQPDEMPGSIRVAVASNGGEELDGHFGSCARFLVYQVSTEELRLIDLRSAEDAGGAEEKNAFRADLINDCHILYVQSIGGPAAAKVVRSGVYPMKVPEGGKALETIRNLQSVMAGSPPPWLAKVMGVSPQERVRFATEVDT